MEPIDNDPRLDALDPLMPKEPAPADPDVPTEAEKEAALARVREETEKAKAEEDAIKTASAEFEAAVDAFIKTPTTETQAAIVPAMKAALALGVDVDVPLLVRSGIVDENWNAEELAEEDVDLDAVIEEPEPEPTPVRPDVDPMVLVPDMVPVYNPTPMSFDLKWNGQVWPAKANGVSHAHVEAVALFIGLENSGGTGFSMGLRRLYGPEPRFVEVAEKAGLSLEAWCERRNSAVRMMADAAWAKVSTTVMASQPDSDDFGLE